MKFRIRADAGVDSVMVIRECGYRNHGIVKGEPFAEWKVLRVGETMDIIGSAAIAGAKLNEKLEAVQ